jgi:hypothetical protein
MIIFFLLLLANYIILSILYYVTSSGIVNYSAIDYGTPNSSIAKFASGEITDLAQKSTLLPIKFYLNRPSLPFNRARIDFKGYDPFYLIFPALSESINLATSFNNSGNNLSYSYALLHAFISLFLCIIFLYILVY